jgi:hypothetical protein
MKFPFTTEEFFGVFEKYNHAVWPMQYILVLLSIVAILLGIKRRAYSAKTISVILSFLWLWMGAIYHLSFFTVINKAAYIFGAVFILQGILFLFAGFRNQLSFQFRNTSYGITGGIFMLYALIVYPLVGYYLGRHYPSNPTFGLPCPTTIFTFGMLLWMSKKCPVYILIIPFLWSVIGFSAALSLGIKEDTGLLIAGIFSFLLILVKNKKKPTFI